MKKLFLTIALVASMSAFAAFTPGMSDAAIKEEVESLLNSPTPVPMAQIIADAQLNGLSVAEVGKVQNAIIVVHTANLVASGKPQAAAAAEASATVSTAAVAAIAIVANAAKAPAAGGLQQSVSPS